MYSDYTCMFLDHTFNSSLPKSMPPKVRVYSPVAKNVYEESSLNRLAKIVSVPKEILQRVYETKETEEWNGWIIEECYVNSDWHRNKMEHEKNHPKKK